MFRILGVVLVLAVAFATALKPLKKFKEGSCSSAIPLRPVHANRDWVHSLEYISAGNKYRLYRYSSGAPNYHSMREDEFYYDSCLTRNTSSVSSTNSLVGIFGFGRTLATFKVIPKPGIYVEAISKNPSNPRDAERDVLTVTLTDNKSFAFLVICRTRVDERSWLVVSNTPNLDPKAMRRIEDHAASLGFKRENFVFLKYDSCHWENPLVEHGKGTVDDRKPPSHNDVGGGWTA